MRVTGFPPYAAENADILILGSFPSVKSREQRFYYGHPSNRFWKVLAEFFGEPLPRTTEEKKSLLRKHRIALWDIVTECEIVGSADSSIRNSEVADVPDFIARHPVKKILLNGKTAFEIFKTAFPELLPCAVLLPSTSPANPRFDKTIWFDALRRY